MNLDEILFEWSYRCPKGYPTIKDGKFVDRDEVAILNELLSQNEYSTIPLPEKKVTKEVFKQPVAFSAWWSKLSATQRTVFFELIPIVQAVQGKSKVTTRSIIKTIENNNDLDWGDIGDIIAALKKLLAKSPESVSWLDNYYLAGKLDSSPITATGGMTTVFNNKKASSFIWSRIKTFYGWLKDVVVEKNKVFTADVILLWGVDDPFTIQDKIKAAILKPKRVKGYPSIIDLGNNQYMACVSLKAGQGRIGKLTSYMNNFLPQSAQNESTIFEVDGFKKLLTTLGGKVSEYWNKLKSFFTSIITNIKQSFSQDNETISLANTIGQELDEFEKMIDEAEPMSGVTTEADKDEFIVCTTCMQARLQKMSGFLNKFMKGTAFNEFDRTMKLYQQTNGFAYKFSKIDTKKAEVAKISKSVEVVVQKLLKAKVKDPKALTNKSSCAPLDVQLRRSELKNILHLGANENAIYTITNLLKSSFPSGMPTNSKVAMKGLVKVAINLNAQSVFGLSGNLPLAKFTGRLPVEELGTKDEYIQGQTDSTLKYVKDMGGLPVIALKITPSSGKAGSKESPFYYSMLLYTLYDIEPADKITPANFIYAVIALKANSGSDFSYAVEADATQTGAGLLKTFAS